MYIMEEIYVYVWRLYIKSLITVPCLAHFSMPSFYLCLSHCHTSCTVWLMVWLKRGHKSSAIQRMITCFKTDALLSFNSRPVNMSNRNRRSSSLTTASVTSSWLTVYHLPSAVTTSSSTCQVVERIWRRHCWPQMHTSPLLMAAVHSWV